MQIRFDAATVGFEKRIAVEPLTLVLSERRIGVIGLNGSGKTTFARMINGLVKPSAGCVTVNGLDTVTDSSAVLSEIGFIFQNPQNQIILPIIREDIAFGLKNRGLSKPAIEAAVDAVLARFDIAALGPRRAHELSGGELQLAALCAVLVTGPKILILDEPTNQLDLKNRALVQKTIAGLDEDVIVISHDLALLDNFDRILLFSEGRLVGDGQPAAVIEQYRTLVAG